MSFPKLSIATKLYAIFALLATITVALALVAVTNARRHAALTEEFKSAFDGSLKLERINSLIYAVGMESRGVAMAASSEDARKYAAPLRAYNDRVGDQVTELQWNVRPEDSAQISAFSNRILHFQELRRGLLRDASDRQVSAGNERDDGTERTALNKDIEALGQLYSQRSKRIYSDIEQGISGTAWLVSILSAIALLLAAFGAIMMWRAFVRPMAEITRVTESVAEGNANIAVPYRGRRDEIGALATSVAVFQAAMRHNEELNKTVSGDVAARAQRQDAVVAEITRFSSDVEATLEQLLKLSEAVRTSAKDMKIAVEATSDRTTRATSASAEANANVRDIASAADELAASVLEIERQVSQANTIAIKAVGEAEQTNATVKQLSDAAGRIGDVIRLITDIAEQTNLLALNATIEAARAGDAGRGFAVVAGEVKALAGQTAKATEEIGAQIAAMQQATERSISAIGAIERTIREIGDISGAIAAAVTEQGAATQEIARSVESASLRSSETADQINRVNEATESTSSHATQVRNVADDLGSVASHIRSQIDEFFKRLRAA